MPVPTASGSLTWDQRGANGAETGAGGARATLAQVNAAEAPFQRRARLLIGLEFAIALAGAPAAALFVAGFGLRTYLVAVAALQLAAVLIFAREAWGVGSAHALLRALPGIVALWIGGALLYQRTHADDLPIGLEVACVAVWVILYVPAAAWASRDSDRAPWALPLAAVPAFAAAWLLSLTAPGPAAPLPVSALHAQAREGVLLGTQGVRSGASVAAVDDLDGDGKAEVAVGAPNPGYSEGSAYVAYSGGGHASLEAVAASGGEDGFRIAGRSGDQTGFAVASVGDQDGDGHGDLLIGSPTAANRDDDLAGAAHVVSTAHAPAHGSMPLDGARAKGSSLRLDGAYFGDATGWSVAGGGDIDGDGVDELVVGAPRFGRGGAFIGAGAVYVLWGGKRSGVSLATVGDDPGAPSTRGYRIVSAGWGSAGWAIANVGDVNGDKVPDLALGVPDTLPHGRNLAGTAFVIYGQTGKHQIDLGLIGAKGNKDGFRIDGGHESDRLGWAVAPAGDVNGDGLADVAIGAPRATHRDRDRAGTVYIVFGQSEREKIDLAELGDGGYRIDGANGGHCISGAQCGDEAGTTLAAAGDLNGDGLADLLVGAPEAVHAGRYIGSVFVVYGHRGTDSIDLRGFGSPGLDPHGYRIDGVFPSGRAGAALAVLHDAEKKARIAIGAPDARVQGGATHLVAAP